MGKESMSQPEALGEKSGYVQQIAVGKLRLDSENPRLPEEAQGKRLSQNQLLGMMVKYFSLKDLGRSFADYGYFPQEPMVVLDGGDGTYTVVEGNRRLAALTLLTDDAARKKFGDDEWDTLASQCKKRDLGTVPCFVSESRSGLTSLLGFRHVSGILPWESIEKARFVHQLIDRDRLDFAEAARAIGSKSNAVQRLYLAYRIVVQARDKLDINPEGAVKLFGVFQRSLSTAGVREFIGLTKQRTVLPLCRWPVPKAKADRLKELFSYMFGDEHTPAVMTDSRLLDKLGAILRSRPALENLRANRNLDMAYELSEGEEKRLIGCLQRASYQLDEALRDAHRHRGSPRVAEWVKRCCGSVREISRHFPEILREYFRT